MLTILGRLFCDYRWDRNLLYKSVIKNTTLLRNSYNTAPLIPLHTGPAVTVEHQTHL